MAVQRPRIVFTPSAKSLDILTRMAELGGNRASAIVAEIIDEMTPTLETIVTSLERVRDAKEETRLAWVTGAEKSLTLIQPHADAVADLFAQITALAPPSSNTGATTPAPPSPLDRQSGS